MGEHAVTDGEARFGRGRPSHIQGARPNTGKRAPGVQYGYEIHSQQL